MHPDHSTNKKNYEEENFTSTVPHRKLSKEAEISLFSGKSCLKFVELNLDEQNAWQPLR